MKKPTFNGNYLLDMFVFTLVDNVNEDRIISFYYEIKKLGLNELFNFVFKDKTVHKSFKNKRLKTNLHLHEMLSESFLADVLEQPQPFLFVDIGTTLIKNPVPIFQDALTRSEVVFYELKYNYKFFGANYNNDFRFYYPTLMDDYEIFLQKNEGNIYTLPSCGLTTTKLD